MTRITIQEGKYYVDGEGSIHGPAYRDKDEAFDSPRHEWMIPIIGRLPAWFDANGKNCCDVDAWHLVREATSEEIKSLEVPS